MRALIRRYSNTLIALFIVTQIISSIRINGNWNNFFYAALVLMLLLYVAKPLANIILLPINILTLNLSSWLVNFAFIFLWSTITPNVTIGSWQLSQIRIGPLAVSTYLMPSWQVIILATVTLTVIMLFIDWLYD